MGQITFRFRDYKDPNLRGTYLCVNNKQMQRVSARQLSRKEQNQLRKQMILTDSGYIETKSDTYQKQIAEDQIKEVKTSGLNIEISDIYKDNKKYQKEPVKDRKYLATDEKIDDLDKMI